MGKLRSKLLPKKTINGKSFTETLDAYNYPSHVETPFTLERCTVQPLSGYSQQSLPEGYRDKVAYNIFTETPVTSVLPRLEGGDTNYQLEVRSGVWCDVIQTKVWEVGVKDHYEIIVVETNER